MAASGGDPALSPAGEYPRRPRDARRTGARILDTAEGVLAAVRRCRVDSAFVELMQTAKRHRVNPVSLADALVTIAEGQLTQPLRDIDRAAVAVARATWAHLLGGQARPDPDSAEGGQADDATDPDDGSHGGTQGPVAGRPV